MFKFDSIHQALEHPRVEFIWNYWPIKLFSPWEWKIILNVVFWPISLATALHAFWWNLLPDTITFVFFGWFYLVLWITNIFYSAGILLFVLTGGLLAVMLLILGFILFILAGIGTVVLSIVALVGMGIATLASIGSFDK